MEQHTVYHVLLYYKYVRIADYEEYAKTHLEDCKRLGLKGRILVAEEGINGTVAGTPEQTNAYIEMMKRDERFADMVFKIDTSDTLPFKKIFVRPRSELVTFRLDEDIDPNEITGTYLSPREFYEQLQQEDVIVLDGRNDYEYDIGHFRNAIRPDVEAFRDFPNWIRENLSEHKDKKILTYCTGGIRCEKLSGFLIREGFEDVSQLEGGIITYGQDPEVKGRLFDGKCYVFDERISVPINRTEEDIVVGRCFHCGTEEDRYVNCAYDFCHRQHICCTECEADKNLYCSIDCEENDIELQATRQG